MSRHDVDAIGDWSMHRRARHPVLIAAATACTDRGAHRADYELSAWSGRPFVDLFGLRRNETTGGFHPSRLVGK